MVKEPIRKTAFFAGAFLLAACTTIDRDVQTPTGPQPSAEGPLHILRVVRKATTTGNQSNAHSGPVEEAVSLSCPANTVTVVPVIEQEAYGFGEIAPDDLSMVDPATGVLTFTRSRAEDHHFGAVVSGVQLTDIDAPDASGEQNVTLTARAWLTDNNGDDRWWWAASYLALCVGTPAG